MALENFINQMGEETMMNEMMQAMIRTMSVEEREAMMLQMMREMMKEADLNSLMGNMMQEIGKIVTLYGIYALLKSVSKEEELTETLGTLHASMIKEMSEMMPMMMPVMEELMPKMMGAMMPMMSGMITSMGETTDCPMTKAVEQDPELKEMMGKMMFAMCPKMAGKVISPERGVEFVTHMEQTVLIERGVAPLHRETEEKGV